MNGESKMIGRKTRAAEWRDEQMLNPLSPATPAPDLHGLIDALAGIVSQPGGGKKFIEELHAASAAHRKSAAEAKAEQQKLHELRAKTEDELHDARAKHYTGLDKHEAEVTARLAAREKAVAAREKAAAELAANAEAIMKQAAEQQAAVRRRIVAFDSA
jgi:peptidoglycan hydrolase CwlO-like protein